MKTEDEIRQKIEEHETNAQDFVTRCTFSKTEEEASYWVRLANEEREKALALHWVLEEAGD